MPIFRVKSVKIYTGQKKFTRIYLWDPWQIRGMIRRMSLDCNCNVFKMQIFALSAPLQTINTEYQQKLCTEQDALGHLCSLFQWKLHFMRTWLFALPAHWFTVTDMEFVKKIPRLQFLSQKNTSKNVYFTTFANLPQKCI